MEALSAAYAEYIDPGNRLDPFVRYGAQGFEIFHALCHWLDHIAIATPVVNWLEKRLKIVKKLGSALIVIVVLALIVLLIYFAVSKVSAEIGDLIKNFPDLYAQLEEGLRGDWEHTVGVFSKLPAGIQNGWNAVVANLDQSMGELVTKISQPTVTAAGNFAKSLPSYLIAFIVAMMSAYFFTVQREEVILWLKKVSPPSVEKRMSLVMDNLKYAVGGYFKAQFKIMGIVFLILFAGLGMFGVLLRHSDLRF